MLSAARLLAGRSPKPAAAEVFRSLTEAVSAKGKPKAKEASRAFVIADGKKLSLIHILPHDCHTTHASILGR